MEVRVELWCTECDYNDDLIEYEAIDLEFCPVCGSDIDSYKYGECDHCGSTVPLTAFTNQCPECGALYNSFGQKLAPPEEWDDEDRYYSFGPQNGREPYDYYDD